MAELFTGVGLFSVALLGLERWWETRHAQSSPSRGASARNATPR